MGKENGVLPPRLPSLPKFRFGSGRLFESLGSLIASVVFRHPEGERAFQRGIQTFRVDIADVKLPLSISRDYIEKIGSAISFQNRTLDVNNNWNLPLTLTKSGHIAIAWNYVSFPPPTGSVGSIHVFVNRESSLPSLLSVQQAVKIRNNMATIAPQL